MAEPAPTYVAGFRQWRTLGRSVDRGQTGYMIFAPILAYALYFPTRAFAAYKRRTTLAWVKYF